VAGAAGSSGGTDGVAADARFLEPQGVATGRHGNIFVADTATTPFRRIDSDGRVSTLAGAAGSSGTADGLGAQARFSKPQSVATDTLGNVYVADTGNHTIRKIDPMGVVTTIAGVAGVSGFSPGTLPGVLASPQGIAVSGTSLYITLYNGVQW